MSANNNYFLTQEEAELGSLVARHDNHSPRELLAATIRAECPPDKTVRELLGGEGSILAKENQDLARQHYADKDIMLTMQKLDSAIANDINYQYLAQQQYVDRDPVVLGIATNVTKGSKKRKLEEVDEAM